MTVFREWFQSLTLRQQDIIVILTVIIGSAAFTAFIGHIYDKWVDHYNKLLDKRNHK